MTLPGLRFEHAAGDGGVRDRTQVVIIHATDNTASAESEAGYATHRPDQTSAHVYVDDNSAVQALRLDHIAYGALWHGNQISVQFELCGRSNHLTDATMRQAAPLVAEVCKRYGIPIRKISASQIRNGVKGICGHADITAAFPQDGGDHTDPGNAFPWSRFIDYVAEGDQEDDMDQATFNKLLRGADIIPIHSGKDPKNPEFTLPSAIEWTYEGVKQIRAMLDPAKFAAAVAPELVAAGAGQAVTDAQLERVLRKVLGSLDDK